MISTVVLFNKDSRRSTTKNPSLGGSQPESSYSTMTPVCLSRDKVPQPSGWFRVYNVTQAARSGDINELLNGRDSEALSEVEEETILLR
mmetsp:Transcript_32239/g.36670  ORF Transcript_32239/g.36670 Transcript_32239/m.36670 type:complete len:89 (+) Transcript_32239:2242-2508(+)